jgi:hypothetical protein
VLLDLWRRTTLLHNMGVFAIAHFTLRDLLLLRKLRAVFPLAHSLLALAPLAHTLNRRIDAPVVAAQSTGRAHLLAEHSF